MRLLAKLEHRIAMSWSPSWYKNLVIRTLEYMQRGSVIKPTLKAATLLVIVPVLVIYLLGLLTLMSLYQDIRKENREKDKQIEKGKYTINKLEDTLTHVRTVAYNYAESREYKVEKIKKLSGITIPKSLPDEHLNKMVETADYYDIPYKIYFRRGAIECYYYTQYPVSPKGAIGYDQLMPSTFKEYGKRLGLTKHTPINGIKVAGLVLSDYYKLCGKDWSRALAAYNAGPSRVKNGIPNITETKNYVNFITDNRRSLH